MKANTKITGAIHKVCTAYPMLVSESYVEGIKFREDGGEEDTQFWVDLLDQHFAEGGGVCPYSSGGSCEFCTLTSQQEFVWAMEQYNSEKGFNNKVLENLENMRAASEAKRVMNEMMAAELPPVLTGVELAEKDFPSQDWLLKGLVENGQRVILSGYRKAGKTTAFIGALKSIVDGDDFMGYYESVPSGECPVLYLNLEVPERTMRSYLFDTIGIKNKQRLRIWDLLGYKVDILNDPFFERLRDYINGEGVCCLFVDPLRQFYTGDENDNTIAKEVTDRIDLLMKECDSLQTVFIVAHTGHENGGANVQVEAGFARPRGASKWGDWADVLMALSTRGQDRFFAYVGRNGEMPDKLLRLVPDGFSGKSVLQLDMAKGKTEVKAEGVGLAILRALAAAPDFTTPEAISVVDPVTGEVTEQTIHPGTLVLGAVKAAVGGRDTTTISGISTLVRLGHVYKWANPGDKREKLVTITAAGREALQAAEPEHLSFL